MRGRGSSAPGARGSQSTEWEELRSHWAGEESGAGRMLLKGWRRGGCPLSCGQWEPLKAFEEENGWIRAGL